jgi:hypothetical protein
MKRDLNLYREILLRLEADETDPVRTVELTIDGYSEEEICFHVRLMAEAGLLHATDFSSADGSDWRPQCITAYGYDYLDDIRDPAVWEHVRGGAKKLGGVSLQVLGAIARAVIQKEAKERLGFDLDI